MTTATLPLIDWRSCAHAGPEIVNHPGRRLCNCPKLMTFGVGVSSAFCDKCQPPYHRDPDLPPLVSEVPTRVAFRPFTAKVFRNRQCRYEGPVVQPCSRRDENRHIRQCLCDAAMEGEYTYCARNHDNPLPYVRNCSSCPHYAPAWPLHFDSRNLAPHLSGQRFNASLIRWGDSGGYLLAWRNGWRGSEIYLSELDPNFHPTGRHVGPLALHHAQANYGREDPRLFMHDGALHIAYIGVVGGSRIVHTNQMYARLNDDLSVASVHYPHYERRNSWEKNWSMWSHDGVLYAIYRITPHQVLRIEGDRATLAFEHRWPSGWEGGEMRGGSAPMRVGDEYWCFFHDRVSRGKRLVYRMGLYTFEARPPFRPLRIIREPLLSADEGTLKVPHDNYADVIFPGGAVLVPNPGSARAVNDQAWRSRSDIAGSVGDVDERSIGNGIGKLDDLPPGGLDIIGHGDDAVTGGDVPNEGLHGKWIIAAGAHDRYAELHRFDHAALDARLVPVEPAAVDSGISGDVLLAALLVGGSDAFYSGIKVRGEPCKTSELSAAELGAYLAPFAASVECWGARGVVLHDGLPAEVIAAHPSLTFCRVNPAGVRNYERRWYAWRDWLNANQSVARVWCVDVNDVFFTAPPFAVIADLPAGHVAAAVESEWTYATKDWYADQLARLPEEYREAMLGRHGGVNPLNCGAWAADAPTAREVCASVCGHIDRLESHAVARHPHEPVVCDMIAFGRVLLEDCAERVRCVSMDGSPLIHDRPRALAAIGR